MTARFAPIDLRTYKPSSHEETPLEVVLNDWPSAQKVDLIPAKQLLAICIANVGVDVMVIEYGAKIRIGKHASGS